LWGDKVEDFFLLCFYFYDLSNKFCFHSFGIILRVSLATAKWEESKKEEEKEEPETEFFNVCFLLVGLRNITARKTEGNHEENTKKVKGKVFGIFFIISLTFIPPDNECCECVYVFECLKALKLISSCLS
jgi:hypothetical protein